MKQQIIIELYNTIMLLGGKSDILSTIGSIGDTISDEDALSLIKIYNKSISEDLQGILHNYKNTNQ